MVCVKVCMISVVMGCVFLSLMMTNPSTDTYRKFVDVLDEKQKTTLDKITEERQQIFYISLGIGVVLSLLFSVNLYHLKYSQSSQICIFFIALISIITLVYMVYPKSDGFLRHLKTDKQKTAWITLRKDIKLKKMFGVLIGLFIYSIMNTL